MIVEIAYRPPLRRWHLTLAEALEAAGHATRLVAAPGGGRSLSATLAMAVDRRLFRKGASLFDVVSERRSGHRRGCRADLVVALDGEHREADAAVLTPLFAGVAGDRGLLEMITGDAVPIVRIVDRDKRDVAIGRPKIDDRRSLSRATEQILARVISLVLQAVRRVEQGRAVPDVQPLDATAVSARVGPWTHIGRAVRRTVAARLSGASGGPAHWRVACRINADDARSGPDHVGDGGFVTLAQGHDRFWADPMPFAHDGRFHVFFEDYPYATAKGVIAHVEIDDGGVVSEPKLVLEQPRHLSYPFVCEHRGAIYMLPEAGAARRLQLFRADPFPDRWIPDRILLDDIALGDATPVQHDGRWWLFATSAGDGGSNSDQLCLFHAPDLLGPWRPHADNPVLIDAGAARPAGAMWHENGRLMRIAQDCRGGYGDGLVVCRVDRLDATGYAQTVLERIGPPAGHEADGIHTYNRAGKYELIDLRSPCVRRARGLAGRGARRPAAPRAPERD